MKLLDLFRGVQTYTADAMFGGNSSTFRIDFDQPEIVPTSAFYADESNRLADMAMEWGLSGAPVTAEYAAALSDAYADMASLWRWIESSSYLPQRSA